MNRRAAFFLVGPTASGKTAVSTEIARRTGALVLSADSMLVYRGMDVGTAKPSPAELAGTDLRGVDLVAPDEPFGAGAWLRHAKAAFDEADAAGRDVVVAGGTGFWVSALLRGIDAPPPDPVRRAELARLAQAPDGPEKLRAAAEALMPGSTAKIAADNPRRLVRLVEILESGARPGSFRETAERTRALPAMAGLWFEPEALAARIEARARAMFAGGALLRETGVLVADHPGFERSTAGAGIGYAEALAVLRGEIDEEEAVSRTAARTRRLAKKQRTWWRHQEAVEWVPGPSDARDVGRAADAVMQIWRKNGKTPVSI